MGLLEIGTVIDETYLVGGLLGQGGMGEVYEVTHARLAGRYAMKVLRPEAVLFPDAIERFRREAKIISSLHHPNIVQAIDFNALPNGAPYLVMELVDGRELTTDLRLHGALPLPTVRPIVEQIASALAEAHRHGIVHRDLKPQNIFLTRLAGQSHDLVKVLDFGISKMQAVTQNLTVDSALIGTPRYMSPEQARGRGDAIDHRTDQFALATIAYHMLAGTPAFDGDNQQAILYQVVHESPPPLRAPGLDPRTNDALRAVLERAFSKDREARFADIISFSRAFADAALGLADTAVASRAAEQADAGASGLPKNPTGWVEQATTQRGAVGESLRSTERRGSRRRTVSVAVGAVATVVLAGAVWIARPHRAFSPTPVALGNATVETGKPAQSPIPTPVPPVPAPLPPEKIPAPAEAPAPQTHHDKAHAKRKLSERTKPNVRPPETPAAAPRSTGHLVRPDEL